MTPDELSTISAWMEDPSYKLFQKYAEERMSRKVRKLIRENDEELRGGIKELNHFTDIRTEIKKLLTE